MPKHSLKAKRFSKQKKPPDAFAWAVFVFLRPVFHQAWSVLSVSGLRLANLITI
jgi:hypothetical protein